MITKQLVAGVAAMIFLVGNADAESFLAAPGREVGPFLAAQSAPSPGGGWQFSDDRMLNASVNGQGGWQTITYSSRYDEEIATGIAHSGGHSWRVSNWFHTGLVNPILSPQFASVGEPGSSNNDVGGGSAQSSHAVYDFWFRSAAPDDAHPDPGTFVSTTISDGPGNRMTYLGMFDEPVGPGGMAGNGCPTDNGCFHVDAVEITSGNDGAGDGDATFVDHYSPALKRGVWYRAHIDANFVAGPGSLTTDPTLCPAATTCHTGNDQIRYEIFDASGSLVFDTGNVGSWEAAYFDGRYGNAVGTMVASDYIGFRVSSNADDGTQQPYDTNSVVNRPHGLYIDDLSVTPDVGTTLKTSFDFDRYVATSGNDVGDCSNESTPCLTIHYAISQAQPYDTIHVAKGTYSENSAAGQNLIIDKPVAIEGAQTGVDARTRDVGGSGDGNETIIVPALTDASLTLNSLGDVAVVQITSSGVSLDGLIIDGDNTEITSPVTLNGTNPDADSGIFATGSNITVQNVVIRNVGGSGIFAFMDTGVGGDNLIQFNRFTNVTNPSNWGLGIYAGYNFYAQISDNLMDQVRVGIQTENNSSADSGLQAPGVLRNEIHATRTALFHNLFYGSATTYTFSGNSLIAALNAAQVGEWNGMQIESMQTDQTVVIQGNSIDASALAGSGRPRAGYVLNNWTSSLSATTAIDGGNISNVDAGVLVTDATNYTGPVNGALVQNVAFNNITLGAVYVEDTNEVTGSAAVTIGAGNIYVGVAHELALAGATPTVSFSGITGVDSVLVRAAGNYLFGRVNGGPCNVTQCTVSNASLNTGITAAAANGTVYVENGTFDETATIGASKNGLRLTASDSANQPTLTRTAGGPNQPVLVVNSAKNVTIDHIHVAVDKAHAAEGILANGFVDGLSIHDNQIVQSASASGASYKFTNGISINIDPAHNSLGLPRVDGSSVTIQNNVIHGSGTTNFRAGIAMDASVGTISGNTSVGLNHDAIVRFATVVSGGSNGVSITGNTFNGGGLEFDAPNAGVSPILIDGNTITATPGSPILNIPQGNFEADFSVLRLIDNFQKLPVTVSNNQFLGYANAYRGVAVENFPNTTFTHNTFSPLAGATDFVSLVVSNKEINTDNPAELPYPMSITALRNTFNGSGASNAGRAVEFINDNDANGTASFDALTFGSNVATDANTFDANHAFYFNLVDQNCDTRVPPGNAPQCMFLDYNDVGSVQNTQVRPFRGNVYAVNNLFAGVAPRAMSPLQQAQLNAQTNDVNDDVLLGYVNYGFTGAVSLRLQGPVANVEVGKATAYSAELANTGAALTENVLVHFSISRTGGINSGDIVLQYDAGGGSYQSIPLTTCGANLCGIFGPPGGFPIGVAYDKLTNLLDTFAVADTYTVNASVQGVSSGVIYAVDTLSTQVVQSAAKIGLSLSGPQTASVGAVTSGYSARLTNTGGATAENVLVHFAVSRSGGISAGDLTLQYFDGTSYQTIPLTACNSNTQLCGTFGPQPGGFPIAAGYDATTALQVTYAKSGSFTVNASVDGVTTSTQYASSALTVTVASGTATNIAAFGSQTFSGTAGMSLAPTPAVIVTDTNGNPVAGVTVTFATGANSGTLSGATQITDSNGIATLGGWTLGTAATETVNATATGLTGSPVVFTATVTAQFDVSISMSDGRDYVQYGRTLSYVIVVTNAGPSTASGVQVSDTLPAEVDGANASWICFHSTGATCTSAGSGNLADTATIPSGGSVTYVLSATVLNDPGLPSDIVVNTASVTTTGSGGSTQSATSTTQIVIFRDSFEAGGDGAQSGPTDFAPVATLDDAATLTLNPAQVPHTGTTPAMWLRAIDAQGHAIFRVDSLLDGNNIFVRIVTSAENGNETFSAWSPMAAQPAALALATSSASRAVVLMSANNGSLQAAIPSWAVLPLKVSIAQ